MAKTTATSADDILGTSYSLFEQREKRRENELKLKRLPEGHPERVRALKEWDAEARGQAGIVSPD